LAAGEHDHDFGTERWDTLNRYLLHGGRMNFYNLFCYFYNLLFQDKIPCNLPETLPQEGVYHPDLQEIPNLKEYLKEKIDPEKITVGLWFYQSYWLNDNLRYIDAIIREIELCDVNVICVFHLRYKDADRGNRGADYVVEQFFMKDGKSVIDVLISPMMFSLTLSAPEYKELLPRLDVPFIQAIITMNPYAEWKESLQGVSTMDVSYSVPSPNLTGLLLPCLWLRGKKRRLIRSPELCCRKIFRYPTVSKRWFLFP